MATPPLTIQLLLEQISDLQSRKAVFTMLIAHLRICYCESDSGPAELRVVREDFGVVPPKHLEKAIIELEARIDVIDAELDELQNQPFGGGTPPAAEVKAAKPQEPEKKGAPSARTRAQGNRPNRPS